jgi:hypothetical protein
MGLPALRFILALRKKAYHFVRRGGRGSKASVRKPRDGLAGLGAGASVIRLGFGGPEVATALYIVIESRGKWWVDFEGRAHGPHDTREAAALEARSQAAFMAHMARPSEVLVPDGNGKYWVVWNSRDSEAGVPRSIGPAATKAA